MKNLTKIFLVFLFFIFWNVLASSAQEISLIGNTDKYSLNFDGNYVAYTECLDEGESCNIFLLNRITGERSLVNQDVWVYSDFEAKPSVSGDGRYVVYMGDVDNTYAIIMYDRETGKNQRVDYSYMGVLADGTPAEMTGGSTNAEISMNGRYVVFQSISKNLAPNVTNDVTDVYIRDLVASTTKRANVSKFFDEGNISHSKNPSVSSNGVVTFLNNSLVFVYDSNSSEIVIAPISSPFDQYGYEAHGPTSVSDDGRFVQFSACSTFEIITTCGIYVYDRINKNTQRVDVSSGGEVGNENWGGTYLYKRAISNDGRFSVFTSYSTNLAQNCAGGGGATYIRDNLNGVTGCIGGPSDNYGGTNNVTISRDGGNTIFGGGGDAYITNNPLLDEWINIGEKLDLNNSSIIKVSPYDPSVLVITLGHMDGIYKSINGGVNWESYGGRSLPLVLDLVFSYSDPNMLYAGVYDYGIYKGSNAGENWESIGNNLPSDYPLAFGDVKSVAIDTVNPLIMYIALSNKGIYKTYDGGMNWEASNLSIEDMVITSVVIDPNLSSTLYAVSYTWDENVEKIHKSIDSGATWSVVGDSLGVRKIAMDPSNSSIIYGYSSDYNKGKNIYKSIDSGNSWSHYENGITSSYVVDFVVDPNNTQHLYSAGLNNSDSIQIYESENGGEVWRMIKEFDNFDRVYGCDLAIDSINNYLYVLTKNGLYKHKYKTTINNTPPKIFLEGDNLMTLEYGQSYEEPGFTVTDDHDSDLVVSTSSPVEINPLVPGEYSIVYSVVDSGGLSFETVRTVNVSESLELECSEGVEYYSTCFPIKLELSNDMADQLSNYTLTFTSPITIDADTALMINYLPRWMDSGFISMDDVHIRVNGLNRSVGGECGGVTNYTVQGENIISCEGTKIEVGEEVIIRIGETLEHPSTGNQVVNPYTDATYQASISVGGNIANVLFDIQHVPVDARLLSSRLDTDMIFTKENNPYIIIGDTVIDNNATITINPGVVVKFMSSPSGPGKIRTESGRIIANGTFDEPIVFTSYSDDSYSGDTNGDGDNSFASYENPEFAGIYLSSVGSYLEAEHLILKYAIDGIVVEDSAQVTLNYVEASSNNNFLSVSNFGQAILGQIDSSSNNKTISVKENGTLNIIDSTFYLNNYGVIVEEDPVEVYISNSSFEGNSSAAIFSFSASIIDARDNWWGSITGPTYSENPNGDGEVIVGNINYENSKPNRPFVFPRSSYYEIEVNEHSYFVKFIMPDGSNRPLPFVGERYFYDEDWNHIVDIDNIGLAQGLAKTAYVYEKIPNFLGHLEAGQKLVGEVIGIATQVAATQALDECKLAIGLAYFTGGTSLTDCLKNKGWDVLKSAPKSALTMASYWGLVKIYDDYSKLIDLTNLSEGEVLTDGDAKEIFGLYYGTIGQWQNVFHGILSNAQNWDDTFWDNIETSVVNLGKEIVGRWAADEATILQHATISDLEYIGNSKIARFMFEEIDFINKDLNKVTTLGTALVDSVALMQDVVDDFLLYRELKLSKETSLDCWTVGLLNGQSDIKCENDFISGQIHSPGELRIIDSDGNITGVMDGEIVVEIPGSSYFEERFILTDMSREYVYTFVGNTSDRYGLTLDLVSDGVVTRYDSEEIPITENEVHRYIVDWKIFKDEGDGIEIQIDKNGDGEPEYVAVVTSGFTDTVPPETSIKMPEFNLAIYNEAIKIALMSQDNEGGVGVQKSEYSLDNGIIWQTYTGTTTITGYGDYTILYRSEDWFGNIEETKTANFRIVTARELLQDADTRLSVLASSNPIKQTIKQLEQALGDKYWQDNNILSKLGGKSVFVHLRNAIKYISDDSSLNDIVDDIELAQEILLKYNNEEVSDNSSGSGGGGRHISNSISEGSIRIGKNSNNSATINWLSSQSCVGKIVYSSENEEHAFDVNNTLSYGYANVFSGDKKKATGHELTVSNLESGTTYYYRVISSCFPEVISQEHSFTTKGKKEKIKVLGIEYTYTGNVDSLYGQNKELVEMISLEEAELVYGYSEVLELTKDNQVIFDKLVASFSLSEDALKSIAYFVQEGTKTTKRLGAGERAGVLNSYYSAFGVMPESVIDWQDVIKIANGRWPGKTNKEARTKATGKFSKVYRRAMKENNQNDDSAITIISYGLRPANRNMESEKSAIKTFKDIYGINPESATDWDLVRAIAYSGCKR